VVTTVAGRDARGTPAAARPLLGAGSTYWLLLAVVCALLVIGLVMVLSASSVAALAKQGDSYAYFKRQLLWVASGVVVMVVVSRIDYRLWRRLGTPLLVMATAGLVYVLVHPAAVSAYGSTRWISIGGALTVQPAEFAKLALLLFSADVLTRKSRLLGDVRHLLVPVLPLTLLLAALVMLEPDLGTTLLLCAIAFGMLFVAGAPLLLLGGVGSLGLAAGVGLILSAPYRRSRFFSFMDPAADPQNAGYQFIQGRLALGSGGLLGVGLGAGRQKWSYVPNAHTDFIFAIIGEELGLLGTLSILLLFVAFAYAGVRVAQRAPDPFGRYLAGGVTLWIVVQALVNIGAVVGVLPITGVPLPLVSFGGSSMLVLLAATGMLLNVARHEVWTVRRSVIATTTKAAADRRGRRSAGRAPARPARGRPASVRTTTHGGGHRQTPAQKARADAERTRRTKGTPPARTPRKEPR
jgi:cell division protein FtsW